ncbi:peroxiredoxin family protein [Yeosuana sp. AK3]
MKKKIILITSFFILISIVAALIYKISKTESYKISIAKLPNIALSKYAVNGNFSMLGDVNCFLIFNTECSLCLDEIEDIVDNIDDFKYVKFYLISNETKDTLLEYAEDSEFLGLENFTILRDYDGAFYQFFNYKTTPSVYVYSRKGKLISYKNGYVPVEYLKNMMIKN